MTFTESDSAALCALIAGFDNRFDNDHPARVAWRLAANEDRWSLAAAVAAVTRFYVQPREANEAAPRLTPGHISRLIRQMRPGGTGPRPASEVLGRGQSSSAAHRARLRERVAFELEARMGRVSSVKARVPWHDGPVQVDSAAPVGAVDVGAARARLRILVRGGPVRDSAAFKPPRG